MSAEQRGPTSVRLSAERTEHSHPNRPAGSDHRDGRPLQRPSPDSDRREPLTYQIERARLRTRIAALEQLVETSERRRQAVIDQYEQLLADRADNDETTTHKSESKSRSLLAQLVDR